MATSSLNIEPVQKAADQKSRRMLRVAVVLLVFSFVLFLCQLATLGVFQAKASSADTLPISIRAESLADYSKDAHEFEVPAISENIFIQIISDIPGTGSPEHRMGTLQAALLSPVPTMTGSAAPAASPTLRQPSPTAVLHSGTVTTSMVPTSRISPSPSPTPTQTMYAELVYAGSPTKTKTAAPIKTATPQATASSTSTFMATLTQTTTNTATLTPSITNTLTPTSTATSTATSTNTPTFTSTATSTNTPTSTATNTATFTASPNDTPPFTDSPAEASTETPSVTPAFTRTPMPTDTATATSTHTATIAPTFTSSPTDPAVSSPTASLTSTATYTPIPTATPTMTFTATSTPTNTATASATSTLTFMPTYTATPTLTLTATQTGTVTPTYTPTVTFTPSPSPTPGSAVCYPGMPNGILPSDDSFIKADAPLANYGNDTTLDVRPDNDADRRGLVKFDLNSIPSNSTVTSATLYLYAKDNKDTQITSLYRVTANWNENTVTWLSWTQPGGDFNNSVSHFTFIPNQSSCMVTMNITSLVQSWVNGTYPNYGLMLYSTGSSHIIRYVSKEDGVVSERPRLDVIYSALSTPTPTQPGP